MTNNGAIVYIYILIMTVKSMVQSEILITRIPWNLVTMKIYSFRSLTQRNLHFLMEYSQLLPWKFQ